MYPLIGKGEKKSDFVIALTTQIMKKQPDDVDEKNNPLSGMEDDSLGKIFNGKISLSKKNTGVILSKLDKKRFEGYLSDFPEDLISEIGKTMKSEGIMIEEENEIITCCADLFASILKERAYEDAKKSNSSKPSENKNLILEKVSEAHNKPCQNETPFEEMSKIFKEAVDEYHIEDFMNEDPDRLAFISAYPHRGHNFETIVPNRLSQATHFIDDIQCNVIDQFYSYRKETIYKRIKKFTQRMDEYIKYLKANALSPAAYLNRSLIETTPNSISQMIRQGQDPRFKEETDYYRQQLKSLHKEICGSDT
jgi:hypothetical protein